MKSCPILTAICLTIVFAGGASLALAQPAAPGTPAAGSRSASSKDVLTQCSVQVLDEASLSAREAGQIVALDVRENDQVEPEQVLAQIDDEDVEMAYYLASYEFEAAKMAAESDIEIRVADKSRKVALAALEDAEDANKRSNSQIFTDAELRRRSFEVERADAQKEFSLFEQQQAKVTQKVKLAQLKRAQAALTRHKILAPIQGEVVEVMHHVGEWVNPGDPVLRIVRMDKLKVEGYVQVADWPRQELVRRPVEIVVSAPGGASETFRSTITGIGSTAGGADQYMIWAEIDNRREGNTWVITPGLVAEIRLNPK